MYIIYIFYRYIIILMFFVIFSVNFECVLTYAILCKAPKSILSGFRCYINSYYFCHFLQPLRVLHLSNASCCQYLQLLQVHHLSSASCCQSLQPLRVHHQSSASCCQSLQPLRVPHLSNACQANSFTYISLVDNTLPMTSQQTFSL